MDEVHTGPDGIRLGQLLKLAGLVATGGEVKALLQAEQVRVNGAVETRRGAQLGVGDVVETAGRRVLVS